jgi:hypothetical protein
MPPCPVAFMASGRNDWLKNAIIDEVVIYQKPGKPLPRPKGAALVEYDQDQFNQIDASICKNALKGARGQGDCEVYGRLVNKYVDGNLACKWGKLSSTQSTQAVTSELVKAGEQIEKQGAGSVFGLIGTGLKETSKIIGTASDVPCNAYALGLPDTIDSIYAPVPPPATVPSPVTISPVTMPSTAVPATTMVVKNAKITGHKRPAR